MIDYFDLREFIPFTCVLVFIDFLIELFSSSSTEETLLSILTALILSPVVYIIWKLLCKKCAEVKEDIDYRW